jgi:hypothetical protein
MRAALRFDAWRDLPRLRCPTLIVAGDHDGTVPRSAIETLRRGIPHARFALIADSGHVTPYDQAEAFNRVVETFLGGLSEEQTLSWTLAIQLAIFGVRRCLFSQQFRVQGSFIDFASPTRAVKSRIEIAKRPISPRNQPAAIPEMAKVQLIANYGFTDFFERTDRIWIIGSAIAGKACFISRPQALHFFAAY